MERDAWGSSTHFEYSFTYDAFQGNVRCSRAGSTEGKDPKLEQENNRSKLVRKSAIGMKDKSMTVWHGRGPNRMSLVPNTGLIVPLLYVGEPSPDLILSA